MNISDWLEKVSYISKSDIPDDNGMVYYSQFDGSYIIRVGMENDDATLNYLAENEVTIELTHGVGFSPKMGKWYGWSHRAIYGFEIGSTCEKGDCHYKAGSFEDEVEAAVLFWSGENYINVTAEQDPEDDCSIHVSWEYDNKNPNKKLRGSISGVGWHYDPNNYGNGEWVAKSLADAKQMAIDFNKGVS